MYIYTYMHTGKHDPWLSQGPAKELKKINDMNKCMHVNKAELIYTHKIDVYSKTYFVHERLKYTHKYSFNCKGNEMN